MFTFYKVHKSPLKVQSLKRKMINFSTLVHSSIAVARLCQNLEKYTYFIYYKLTNVMFQVCRRIPYCALQMHLFDIDVPGKMTFKESDSMSAGKTPTIFKTGTNLAKSYS